MNGIPGATQPEPPGNRWRRGTPFQAAEDPTSAQPGAVSTKLDGPQPTDRRTTVAHDALDPGPNGDYPWLPRNADGTLDTDRMPIRAHQQRLPGSKKSVLIDPTPTLPDGRRITEIAPPPA